MKKPADPYQLKTKTDAELYQWLVEYKPGTAEYVAGIQESMRRIAIIEQLVEKKERPVRKREMIAMLIAVLALATTIFYIVTSYQ